MNTLGSSPRSDERHDEVAPPADRGAAAATTSAEDEPSVLGAAATLPLEPRTRRGRRARRAARRRGGQPTGPAPSAAASGHDLVEGPEGYSDVVYVFKPHGAASTPLRPYIRSLWERRRFMVELARADLQSKKSSTALGRLWGILDPLFQAGLYFLLFTIIRGGSRPMDFLHILVGCIFLFQLALSSLSEGGKSLRSSKNLMLNSTFPRALFPITTVCRGIMRFPPFILIYVVFHVSLQAPTGSGLLLLPMLFTLQVVLMVGLALLMSTVIVYFKDAENAVQYVVRLLFFTTPVIYPLELIPDGMRAVLSWQPFFALFASYQEILDGGVPSVGLLLQVLLWSVGLLLVGTRVFLRHEREFAIRL
jgi:ABC-type polysaccharide/polyol phosphate export permease